jgi:hypothetical protein
LRRLGNRYDASEKDDDLPCVLDGGAGGLADFVILPNNTVSLDDYPFYHTGQALASEVFLVTHDRVLAERISTRTIELAGYEGRDRPSNYPQTGGVRERIVGSSPTAQYDNCPGFRIFMID